MIDFTVPTNAARRARRHEMVIGAYVVGMVASLPLVMLTADIAIANQECEHLIALGPVVSLEDVIVKAKERQPGRMIEAEVDEHHGKVIYEIDILDALLMMQTAGLSFAYHANPKGQAAAHTELNHCTLAGVLALLED